MPSRGEGIETLQATQAAQFRHDRLCAALANIAHDLKSPVGVLAGYTDLLLSEKVGLISGKQRSVLQEMQQQGRRLQGLVEDVLALGALEAGTVSPRFAVGDLLSVLQEMCAIWQTRFSERRLTLYLLRNGRVPPFAFDAHKVQRVLSNLLENAAKYVPEGGSVTVHAELHRWERRVQGATCAGAAAEPAGGYAERRRQQSEAPNAVRVRVADNGPGIAPEYHLEIFDDFFRLPENPAESDGTGFGLSIARRLVHACGGKIWVESEPGEGCTFSFLLPLKPAGFHP